MPAQIAMLDWDGRIVAVNDAWRRSLCRDTPQGPGHPVGFNYLEHCADAKGAGRTDAHKVADAVRSALKGALDTFSIEYACHIEPATQRQWILLTITRLANGVLLTQSDVTAARESKEQLRESESRFPQMAEKIKDVFFLENLDSSARVRSPTQAACHARPTC